MSARRFTLAGLVVLCALTGVLALASVPALAVKEYKSSPSASFGGEGSGNSQFLGPTGVAVNDSTEPLVEPAAGDVYVVDTGNSRVERFSSAGAYISQFNGSETPAASFSSPEGIAVDNSGSALDPSAGNAYVADTGHSVVDKFSASGEYKGQLTGTGAEAFSEPHGVAVDPSGNVWVYQGSGNLDEFSDTGSFLKTFNTGRGAMPGMAVDATGNVYVISGGETALKYESASSNQASGGEFGSGVSAVAINPSTNNLLVAEAGGIALYGPFGEPYSSPLQRFPGEPLAGPHGIAVNGAGSAYVSQRGANDVEVFDYVSFPTVHTGSASGAAETSAALHGSVNPEGEAVTECLFEYGTTSSYGQSVPCAQTSGEIGSGASPVPVSAEVSGLGPGATYHFRLVAGGAGGTRSGADAVFATYSVPIVEGESVAKLGSIEATVSATIDAGNSPTGYRVAYGPSEAYGSLTPEVSLGAPEGLVGVQVRLSGLQPGAAYHFRFLATSVLGVTRGADMSFTTARSPEATALTLPDGRVYESVSGSTNRGDVYVPEGPPSRTEDTQTERPFRAAAGGDVVAYLGDASDEGGNGIAGKGQGGDQYLATRDTHGWVATNITPAAADGENPRIAGETAYESFSSDLSTGILNSGSYAVAVGAEPEGPVFAPNNCYALYSHTVDTGRNHPLLTISSSERCGHPLYAGSSTSGSDVLFQTEAALTPEAEEATGFIRNIECLLDCNLYDLKAGQLRLVNVLPDGVSAPHATFGGPSASEQNPSDLSHVISDDGLHVFWTDLSSGRLYLRENGTSTVPVSAGSARFWTASADGRFAFYTEGERLWRFDAEGKAGQEREEILGQGAGVQGVIGMNETGQVGAYLYVVAQGVLDSSANGNHEMAAAGQDNLYLVHYGKPTFLAVLAEEDNHADITTGEFTIHGDWQADLGSRTAQVTPDGGQLVFQSSRPLTGYDTSSLKVSHVYEIFVYDAHTGRLFCASCDPAGATPVETKAEQKEGGETYLPFSWSSTYMRRWISEDGSRVFFDTSQPLVPSDTNEVQDVYEWEREGASSCPEEIPARPDGGCVFLLSGGDSSDFSYLVDASANGNDVFITHRGQLGPVGPTDDRVHLYDARVNGGFPEASPACTGAACQGAIPARPAFALPASAILSGAGNFGAAPKAIVRSLTRAQRLARALTACRRVKAKRKRLVCERHARRLYGPRARRRLTAMPRRAGRHATRGGR
jgi:hypothetical protein